MSLPYANRLLVLGLAACVLIIFLTEFTQDRSIVLKRCFLKDGQGQILLRGIVLNPGTEPLFGLTAIAVIYDARDSVIFRQERQVARDPLPPNESSAFWLIVAKRPGMKSCMLEFSAGSGEGLEVLKVKGGAPAFPELMDEVAAAGR